MTDASRPRRDWLFRLLLSGVALTAALAFIQPSASEGLGLAGRLGFWAAHVFSALALLSAAQLVVTGSGVARRWPPAAEIALAALIGALAFSLFAIGLDFAFASLGLGPVDDEEAELAAGFLPLVLGEVVAGAPPAFFFWLLLNAPRILDAPRGPAKTVATPAEAGAEAGAGAAAAPSEFWARLPPKIGRDLVSISAELHYLTVRATGGEAFILCGIGRAVEEIEASGAVEGIRIHRSHWAALSHIEELRAAGGRLECVMDDGMTLPIAKSRRAAVRAALRDHAARSP